MEKTSLIFNDRWLNEFYCYLIHVGAIAIAARGRTMNSANRLNVKNERENE